MKSQKTEDSVVRRRRRRGGLFRPLSTTLKQAASTTPGINKIVPGGRKPVTFLYPYERIDSYSAYRGQHSIDWHKCIGCELCAKVCPNECIYFEFVKVENDSPYLLPRRCKTDVIKKQIRRPAVDIGHCLFCGNCSEYCPTDAWMFIQDFELADYAREDLFYHADELKTPDDKSDKKQMLNNRQGDEPILDVDACIGCSRCERECPTGCISMLAEGPNLRKGKPIPIPQFNYQVCIGCQQCCDVCPADCLHMEEVGYTSLERFYNINFTGDAKPLEEWTTKKSSTIGREWPIPQKTPPAKP